MNQGWRLRYRSRTVLKSTMGSRKSFAIVVYNQRNSTQGYLEDIISIIEFLWYLACLPNLIPLNCLLFNEREPKNSTERTLIVFFQTSYSSEEWSNYLEEYRRTIVLSLVELALRSVKICFGFVNSLVLIILLKPFHEPLIVIKTWIWKQFGKHWGIFYAFDV